VTLVHALKSLSLTYDAGQDRILAVVNPGRLDSWAFWLTRRLTLGLLARLPATLAGTSPVVKQAPAEYRGELAAFEREAALASTAGAMAWTDDSVLKNNAVIAELAIAVRITETGNGFGVELRGERGGQAAGVLGRDQLQRVLQMVYGEATKAYWLGTPAKPKETEEVKAATPKPMRH